MKNHKIIEIDFDFEDDDFECPLEIANEIIEKTKNTVWYCKEEDLVDEISDATGFCVKSIRYEQF